MPVCTGWARGCPSGNLLWLGGLQWLQLLLPVAVGFSLLGQLASKSSRFLCQHDENPTYRIQGLLTSFLFSQLLSKRAACQRIGVPPPEHDRYASSQAWPHAWPTGEEVSGPWAFGCPESPVSCCLWHLWHLPYPLSSKCTTMPVPFLNFLSPDFHVRQHLISNVIVNVCGSR